jgi:LPXTG-site transpeptidase (sortase) family protein
MFINSLSFGSIPHKEKWFRGLARIGPGDSVELRTAGKRCVYLVRDIRVVGPNDAWVLADKPGSWLTLITCTGRPYFGSGGGRLIVMAELGK